ncbi:MAG: putative Ig domain-containing protein [Deltaproteobacteria bacterium]
MKIKNQLVSLLMTLALALGILMIPPGLPAEAATTYCINDGPVTITSNGDYIITGTGTETTNTIKVNSNLGNVNITLNGVRIIASACAFEIGSASAVDLCLMSTNYLSSGGSYPGLAVGFRSSLQITEASTGSLEVIGGNMSAGIGGGFCINAGDITINGGRVIATATNRAAGIGGGYGSICGDITINGGIVTGNGSEGAGIGSGPGSSYFNNVTINGGIVTASSNNGGAGIGSGSTGYCNNVTINGGNVTANSNGIGAGIGGIFNINGVYYPTPIMIDGGSVKTSGISSTVYNSSSIQVYPLTVTGLPANSEVSYSLKGAESRLCATDSEGKLYLWVPATEVGSSTDIVIMVSNDRYIASGTVSAGSSNSLLASFKTMISTTGLPAGTIGLPYTAVLSVDPACSAPYAWSANGLPPGFTFNTENNNGIITGTPADTGDYKVTVTVKNAYDNTDSATFTLTIAQTSSIDLENLTVTDGTLNPEFDKNLVTYLLDDAPADISNLGITATTSEEAGADPPTLRINQEIAQSGVLHNVNLNQGTNLLPIEVTSPDGLSQKCYVISVNGKVSNAALDELTIDGQVLDPVFAPDNLNYSLNVDNSIDSIKLSASPDDSKALMLLNGGLLPDGTETTVELPVGSSILRLMVVAQDATAKTYTVNINRQEAYSIVSEALPAALFDQPYSYTLQAAGGSGAYSWSSANLPEWLSLSEAGVLTGTPTEIGSYSFTVDLSSDGVTVSKDLTLVVRNGTGNGAYQVVPVADASYQAGLTTDNLPTMTIKPGVRGFKNFSVTITPVTGHPGDETVVFVHTRGDKPLSLQAGDGDFDVLDHSRCGFNVMPGDVIKVYLVDALTNDPAVSPVIL